MESTGTPNAAEALRLVAGTRAELADRLVTPWWYHPALGLLIGGWVASYAADSFLVTVIALAVYFAGIATLIAAYRRITGLFVNGLRAGRASRWGVYTGVATAVGLVGSVALRSGAGVTVAPIVAGILLVPLVIYLGHRFDDALRAELRGQP